MDWISKIFRGGGGGVRRSQRSDFFLDPRLYMGKIKGPNHQLNTLIPQQDDREHEYNLRNDNNRKFYLFNNRPYCRTKLCGDFFTFKYY